MCIYLIPWVYMAPSRFIQCAHIFLYAYQYCTCVIIQVCQSTCHCHCHGDPFMEHVQPHSRYLIATIQEVVVLSASYTNYMWAASD